MEALFSVRCLRCVVVARMETNIEGWILRFFRQHRPFMSIKSFVQHSGWQEMVSLCSLIRLIGVCADHDQPDFLCSHSDSGTSEFHVATVGGCQHGQRLLTHYCRREVRNSIYRYRNIYIDYRSKFSYWFISSISIIYGKTKFTATLHILNIYKSWMRPTIQHRWKQNFAE